MSIKILPDDPDKMRMAYGFCLLLILAFLTGRIALGHVEEATSYGLLPLITTLATLAGGFTQWAFTHNTKEVDTMRAQIEELKAQLAAMSPMPAQPTPAPA